MAGKTSNLIKAYGGIMNLVRKAAKYINKNFTIPKYIAKLRDSDSLSPIIDVYRKKNLVGSVELEKLPEEVFGPESMGIRYIQKAPNTHLGKGEYFQQIGAEAGRQYTDMMGKKLVTGRHYVWNPVKQANAMLTGFDLKPTSYPLHVDEDPSLETYEHALQNAFLRKAIDHNLTFEQAAQELEYQKSKFHADGQNYVPIEAVPEAYDYNGNLKQEFIEIYPDADYFNLVRDTSIPGFYASYVGEPKKNFRVQFKKANGGTLNYFKIFK